MADAESLALFAEEADLVKGALSHAVQLLAASGDYQPLFGMLQGLDETADALGLDAFVTMSSWVQDNLRALELGESKRRNGTLVGELLTGWLSSCIGVCAAPDNPSLRTNFRHALQRREWPLPLAPDLLQKLLEDFVSDQTTPGEGTMVLDLNENLELDEVSGDDMDEEDSPPPALSLGDQANALLEGLLANDGLVDGEQAHALAAYANALHGGFSSRGARTAAGLAEAITELLVSRQQDGTDDEAGALLLAGADTLSSQLESIEAGDEEDADSCGMLRSEILALLGRPFNEDDVEIELTEAHALEDELAGVESESTRNETQLEDLEAQLAQSDELQGSELADLNKLTGDADPDQDGVLDLLQEEGPHESELAQLDQLIEASDATLGNYEAESSASDTNREPADTTSVSAVEADGTGEDETDLRFAAETDPRLLDAFFMETPEQAIQLVELLRKSEGGGLAGDEMMEAQRIAHTIKGGCAFVGLKSVYELTYPLEESLEGLATDPAPDDFVPLLLEVADIIELLFDCINAQEESAPIDIRPFVAQLWEWAHKLNPQEEDEDEDEDDSIEISATDLELTQEPVSVAQEPVTGEESPTPQTETEEDDSTDLRFAAETDPRLLDAFFMETPEQAIQLVELLRKSEGGGLAGDEMMEAQRIAHTIKGGCAFVGLKSVYELTYPLEESLEGLATDPAPDDLVPLLLEVADIIELLFDCINAQEESAPIDIRPFVAQLWEWAHKLNPQEEEDQDEDEEDFDEEIDPAQLAALKALYEEQEQAEQEAEEASPEQLEAAVATNTATDDVITDEPNLDDLEDEDEPLDLTLQDPAPLELLSDDAPADAPTDEETPDTTTHILDNPEELIARIFAEGASKDLSDDGEGALVGSQLFEALPTFDLDAVDGDQVSTELDPELDPALVEAFFMETPDQVAELAAMLRSSADGELVGERVVEAQRLAHTIKGACAMAGLEQIRDLAHRLEDLMELLGTDSPPSELGDLLIQTGDLFEQLFDAVQARESSIEVPLSELLEDISSWVEQLGGAAAEGDSTPAAGLLAEEDESTDDAPGEIPIVLAADLDPQLAEAFYLETPDQVAELAVLLRSSERGGMVGPLVVEAQRLAHTVKGASAMVGLMEVQKFAHRLEDVMEGLGERAPEPELAELLVEVADALEGIFDALVARETTAPVNVDAFVRRLDRWAAKLAGRELDEEEGGNEDEDLGDLSAEDLLWDENVDPKMIDEFFIEVPEQARVLIALITDKKVQNADARVEAARLATGIEHWSRTVGIHPLRRIAQSLKKIFDAPRETEFPEVALEMLADSAALLENLVGAVQGKNDPDTEAGEKIQDLIKWAGRVVDAAKENAQQQVKVDKPAPPAAKKDAAAPGAAAESSLRVPTHRIIELMRLVGEMTTAVAQLQGRLAPVVDYVSTIHKQNMITSQKLVDLETLVEVRSQALEEAADFDPLEMDQYHELHGIASALNEAFTDGQEIARMAEEQLQELTAVAYRQERLSREVNEAVLATRMIPVSVLVPRLERTVREACRAAGKKVRIHVEGEHLMADTDIIGGLRDALMHMLRNSVDHGIELPKERTKKGKPEEGRLEVSFRRQGNTIQIRVVDDGGGFNEQRILETARKRGMKLKADMQSSEILRLILMPGFSTKQAVTTLSGRGIGMDVVRQSVEDLGGTMLLANRSEGGAETVIRLPLTLVSAPVLLVRVQEQIFAIPSDDVNQILYPDDESIFPVAGGWAFQLGDDQFRVRSMAALLGRGSEAQDFQQYAGKTVLLIRNEFGFQSVLLDQALASRDVVVQPLGPWLTAVRGIAGACILANGEVAPILDMRVLLRDLEEDELIDLDAGREASYFEDKEERIPLVLVVDDSLSARKSLEIAVEAAGYEVMAGIDGLDAIRLMDERRPDLILSDMEMPRMNGIELTTHVRAQEETTDIPVVMITSRSTKKHRQRAMGAGVTHYLTKPFDQGQLHSVMAELLARTEA